MTAKRYLNFVLSIIAFCLLVITFVLTGIIPSASANESPKNYVSVPVNPDGSLNVRVTNKTDVNIMEIRGQSIPYIALPTYSVSLPKK